MYEEYIQSFEEPSLKNLAINYQGRRTKSLKYSTEHPVLLDVGFEHPIIPRPFQLTPPYVALSK